MHALLQKLHIHIDKFHPEQEEKNFSCEKCQRFFTYEASFNDHSKFKCKYSEYYLKLKNMEVKISLDCDYCTETFNVRKSTRIKNHYNFF